MSDLDHSFAAPIVRGFYIGRLGRPVVLVSTEADEAPEGALKAILGGKNDLAEEKDAIPAMEAGYSSWSKNKSAGVLPGCVWWTAGGKSAAYWVGLDYDEAKRRAEARDASPFVPAQAPASSALSARGRSAVIEGRVALVTGGAQGFGEEIVRGLASSGALVFIADLNMAGAEKLSQALNAEAGKTVSFPVSVNVSDEASVAAMFAVVASTSGGLDLVVSNAGVLKAFSVLEQDLGSFKFVTDVNYVGFMLMTKHAGLLLRRQHRGAPRWTTDIIQINSKSGLEGSNKNGSYAGSKFGGIGLVQSFALELVEYGIKVNAICPGNFLNGPLWSDPVKGLFVQYLNSGKVPGAKTIEDVRKAYEAKVPMRRGCEGADVMRAVYYIVEQEYETGQALPVTGGQVMLS